MSINYLNIDFIYLLIDLFFIIMGGNHSVFSATKFVPNDAVPGQAQSVLEVASVLNISKRDLNKIYAAYVRFHTDGVTFKIVTNYVLLTMGVEATPWNHAIFKVIYCYPLLFLIICSLMLLFYYIFHLEC